MCFLFSGHLLHVVGIAYLAISTDMLLLGI